MSILSKLNAALNKASDTPARVEMTLEQMEMCKTALREKKRGYNVQPNKFDIKMPYRVAINWESKWFNYGNFANVHAAAAVGTIISAAFFGDKAVAGEYDIEEAESNEEFIAWMGDKRNAEVIAKANGETSSIHAGGSLASMNEPAATVALEDNPF